MKASELRDLTDEELTLRLRELKEELLNLRTERALGRLGQPHRFRLVKRDIARISTIIREKETEAQRSGQS
jgi:large subunit ribosomal protein L29